MMEWEKPYMEKSIEVLNPFGKVLEIGFGLGYSATNGSTTKLLEINGSDGTLVGEINVFQSLDMNGQAIKTSSGNLTISNTGAPSTSVFTIATRDNSGAGSGTGLVLSGNTLISSSYLVLTINGVVHRIALL